MPQETELCGTAVGNYVVQGALRFGTDFIFDAMVDRCWSVFEASSQLLNASLMLEID